MDNWKTIIPESPDLTIDRVEFAKGHIIISGLKHAVSHLYVYTLDGELVREIPLPTLGTITGITASLDSSIFYFRFESFLVPPAVYRCDIEKDATPEVVLASAEGVDPDLATIEQVFYSSKDGTRVPMFILKRRGLDISKAGPVPTVLSGYGGFNISRTPTYSPQSSRGLNQAESTPRPTCGVAANTVKLAQGRYAPEQAKCVRRFHIRR